MLSPAGTLHRPGVGTLHKSPAFAEIRKKVVAALFPQIIALSQRKDSRRQAKTPLVRLFVGYTSITSGDVLPFSFRVRGKVPKASDVFAVTVNPAVGCSKMRH